MELIIAMSVASKLGLLLAVAGLALGIIMGTIAVTTKMVFTPAGSEQVQVDTGQEINSVTTVGEEVQQGVQVIGFSGEEQIVIATDIGTPGWLWIKNLDPTNFVQLGAAAAEYFVRLNPGEVNMFRLDEAAGLFLLADTGDCRVQYKLFET